uniref:Retrovirus-related Pol polyprotein from transposon TNT 1-94 n=1 Tax=Cannabis sativa TaxID=3483 RepID=A0A803QAK8_CANSA
MAATEAVKETLWLKGLAKELGLEIGEIIMYCDNQFAQYLMNKPMFYKRSKHMVIKLYFIRDVITKKEVAVKKNSTHDNLANMFTKSVTCEKFKHYLKLLNIE